jgi:O-antigen/teichoic acid export membrane protein
MTANANGLGTARTLGSLAGARVVAQGLGLAWFLLAARALDAHDFGVLSIGLVLVVVIGGLSDLGTTRTVVRHVAADPTSLRANYLHALALRCGAGVAAAVLTAAGALLAGDGVPVAVLVLAALVALASGATEIGFAALRSVGRVGPEVRLLVGERILFVLAGAAVLAGGGGPVAVLAVYATTNLLSAVLVGVAAVGGRDGRGSPASPMLDAEGRRTAVSSTLMILGPRISALLLVLLATPTVVGTFSIGQKVPEALGVLGTAALLPVLPLLRAAAVARDEEQAVRHAALVTTTIVAALVPLTVWLCLDGERLLDVLFGAGDRSGAAATLGLLAVVTVLWVLRTYGEIVLLARERADRYLVAVAAGVGVNIALGVPAILWWDAAGAALAALGAELVVLAVALVAVGATPRRALLGAATPAFAVGAGAALTLGLASSLPFGVSLALTGMWCLLGLTTAGRGLRGPRSGAAGDHADVGEEVGGDVVGDGVEAVEHLTAPAEHL